MNINMHAYEPNGTLANFRRLGVVLLISVLALAFLAGCGERTDQPTGQTSIPATASRAIASPSLTSHAEATVATTRSVASPATIALATPGGSPSPPSASSRCRSSDLDLEVGQPVAEPTGQHTISLTLTNRSPQACSLFGYPQVTLLAASGQALPFEYRQQGDQVVASAAPNTFDLAPGAVAYVTLNKYRCDLGDKAVVSRLQLLLPGDQTALGLPLPSGTGVFGYCGADDPGSIVSISPLEATFRATLSH